MQLVLMDCLQSVLHVQKAKNSSYLGVSVLSNVPQALPSTWILKSVQGAQKVVKNAHLKIIRSVSRVKKDLLCLTPSVLLSVPPTTRSRSMD